MESSQEWLEKAIELYNMDYSYLKIGKVLNVDRKKVAKKLKEKGYLPKYSFETTNGVIREKKIWRKYSFNENYFETIDSEEKAYWLGFIYADGYVNSQKTSFELGLKISDKSHIQKFINSIEGNMPILNKDKKIKGKLYKGCRVTVNSEKFKNDLLNKGCLENKSLILTFPSYDIVPKNLMFHFIRGYVDGDGSYVLKHSKYVGKEKTTESNSISFEVAGTNNFLTNMIDELGLHHNKIHQLHKTDDIIQKDSKRVLYSGPYSINIINLLYKDATIFLDRKYNKIIKMIAVISGNAY